MDILCSDKTGTLTQNRLTLGEIQKFHARDTQEVLLAAALASREENRDAIDEAVLEGVTDKERLATFRQTTFVPFDPIRKCTEATIQDASGSTFQVAKGAPQVIMEMAGLTGNMQAHAQQVVDTLAEQGYRALAVARKESDI